MSRSAFFFPSDVEVVAGTLLAWSGASDRDDISFRGGEDLLAAFLELSRAEPGEMAHFMTIYGIPELCQHGWPDRHRYGNRAGRRALHCPPAALDDGRPFVAAGNLRYAARAFTAAVEVGRVLSARLVPDERAWGDMERVLSGIPVSPAAETYKEGRARLAAWCTDLLRDCGVSPVARWDGPRLHVTTEADGLMGTLAVLLTRELGQGDRYTCDVCGAPVDRRRPPKPGEHVYCGKPACRREQQRRNQANWRARKRAETSGGA